MKPYSLGNPPTCAGIYHLKNKRTGQIYVGQSNGLKRRYVEWKNALSSGFGHTNTEMFDAFADAPDLDEWFFIVVKEMPGASKVELLQAEGDEVERLKGLVPDKVLNNPAIAGEYKAAGSKKPTGALAIKHPSGGYVGQLVASKLLSRNISTIQDKVRWLRDQGLKEIELEDLLLDRRDVAKKYLGVQE